MKNIAFLLLILFMPPISFADQTVCNKATLLVQQAYDMGTGSYARQKELLNQAIGLCPDHPEAHNNLASILEAEKDYEAAMLHYQKAVSARPDFAEAWFGIGEVYYKTGRFMKALEAYLKGCKDKDAVKKAEEMFDNQRYRISEPGEIIDAQSLSILFNKNRRNEFQKLIKNCRSKAIAEPVYIFRNIQFNTGSANLKPESLRQIQEISQALQSIENPIITISGHTDRQPFKGHSQKESNRLNMRLSQDRAESVAKKLINMGIPANHIKTKGYGPTMPMAKGDTPEAYAKNRRVVIGVND